MRLGVRTDFALRTLIYLGMREGELVTLADIAEGLGVARSALAKISQKLVHDGLVSSTRGRKGGLRLARPPSEISVGDVLRVTEADFQLVPCQEPDLCHCPFPEHCRLRRRLDIALDAFLGELDKATVADLVAPQ